MIEIKNLDKSYGEKNIFDNYSISIPDTSLTIITGPSGCGKSTLLNIIGRLEDYDNGEILLNGINIKDIKRYKYFRDYVGFLFQNFALLENKTVEENLKIIKKRSRTDISIDAVLESVGLADKKYKKVYKLSGGEQQRVALARVILKKCDIVLADEPTASLDDENGKLVMELLCEFAKQGKTVIMVTHKKEYLKYAHQSYCLG